MDTLGFPPGATQLRIDHAGGASLQLALHKAGDGLPDWVKIRSLIGQ